MCLGVCSVKLRPGNFELHKKKKERINSIIFSFWTSNFSFIAGHDWGAEEGEGQRLLPSDTLLTLGTYLVYQQTDRRDEYPPA
jgi:hypothetical protein